MGGHREINESLRNGIVQNTKTQNDIFQLDSILNKLPDAPGVSYRGTYLSPAQIEAMRIPGSIINFPTYLSTDVDRYRAEGFAHEHYLLVIEGKTGKKIKSQGANLLENEVLFRRDTDFEVIGHSEEVDTFGKTRKVIRIREIGRRYENLPINPDKLIVKNLLEKLEVENVQILVGKYLDSAESDRFAIAKEISQKISSDIYSASKDVLEYIRVLDNPTLYLRPIEKYTIPNKTEILKMVFEKESSEVNDLLSILQNNSPLSLSGAMAIKKATEKLIKKFNLNPARRHLRLQSVWIEIFGAQQSHILENIFRSDVETLNLVLARSIADVISENVPMALERFSTKTMWELIGSKEKDKELIDFLSRDPEINSLFNAWAGTFEGISVRDHTLDVLGIFSEQFPKFRDIFHFKVDPNTRLLETLKFAIALHDIGKPLAVAKNDSSLQHEFTLPILERAMIHFRFSEQEIQLAKAVVGNDLLGDLIKGTTSVERTMTELKELAARAGMSLKTFAPLQILYYVSDAGSYHWIRSRYFRNWKGLLVPQSKGFNNLWRETQNAE